MAKMQILRAFNEHFSELMDDVIRVFPDDTSLIACKVAIEQMRKANPKLILVTFREAFVNKYREKINEGNIDFFIDNDYEDDVVGAESSSIILEKINLLRTPVRNMKESDKNKTIKYIQNLTRLSDIYTA